MEGMAFRLRVQYPGAIYTTPHRGSAPSLSTSVSKHLGLTRRKPAESVSTLLELLKQGEGEA